MSTIQQSYKFLLLWPSHFMAAEWHW